MRNLGFILSAVVVPFGISGFAHAGDAFGTVQEIHMGPVYGTRVFLKMAGSITAQPACQNNPYHFVFDSNVPGGKELLSAALAAKTSQSGVRVNGYNTCNLYSGVEDLRWLLLE